MRRRLRELLHREALDRETVEELRAHVESSVAEKVEAGMEEGEARRLTRIELGSPEDGRERVREGRTGHALELFAKDLRYAGRILRRSPGVTGLSVLTIAVAVGASALLAALVNGIVLKPLPYPEPERLVSVYDTNARLGIVRRGAASGNVVDWRQRTTLFEGIAAHYTMGRTLSSGPDSEVVLTAQVSEDFFPLLRVPAAHGRTFTREETEAGRFNNAASPESPDPVAVLGHRLWVRRFGADPGIVGRSVVLERRPFRIVGVMPPGFALPEPDVQLFIPWHLHDGQPRDQHYLSVYARLRPGVTAAQAEGELASVAEALGREHPQTNAGWSPRVVPLQEDKVGDAGRLLLVLLGAVVLFLVVACTNVALLSLARGVQRAREAALRMALGASPARLMRQFFLESLVVAAAGGALGAVMAALGLFALQRFDPGLPRLHEVGLDGRVLAFAIGLTAVAAVLAGALPAWRRTRVDPAADLTSEARVTGGGRRPGLRDALVVSEVALAVVLLAGSGLLVRSFLRLRATPTGFDPQRVAVLPVFLDMQAYDTGNKVRAYYARLMERLSALPGVTSVGGATALPTSPLGPDFERPVWRDGDTSERAPLAWVRMVTPGYFETLGMTIHDGRGFDDREAPGGPSVVMVSEGLAQRLWPGERAVGRRMMIDYSTAGTYRSEVVGVVGDVRFRGPRSDPRLELYIAHAQRSYLILNVAVRTTEDPRRLAPAIRAVLRDIDPQKPAHGIHTLDQLLGATVSRDRQAMLITSVFAGAAVLLSALSLYAMLALRVRERLREIAVRLALGAPRANLLLSFTGYGLRLVAAGVLAGLGLAVVSTRALAGMLFGVSPTDPATALAVALLPLVVGIVAAGLPAWRASRVDPANVLRQG